MRTRYIIVVVLLAIAVAGCKVLPTTTFPTMTSPQKQPEPNKPKVSGEISGVLDDALVTVRYKSTNGMESGYSTIPGNGLWETVLTGASGVDYIVTAEAKGYISVPVSYTIHLDGTKAYMVVNDQITIEEASHLDFHFNISMTPTPGNQ